MINNNIQIMRAISLIMVFLFHLDVRYFKVGYLGVDIFFVISGFLMPLIMDKYNAFSYIKARAVRLYPALSFVLLVALVIGYFILMPGEYLSLSQSALSSLLFSSNYFFLFNTGYFDIESKLQFLLHTWSLGNEFFCYIIIFLIWCILGKKHLFNSAIVIAIAAGCYVVFKDNLTYLDPLPRLYLFFSAFCIAKYFSHRELNNTLLLLLSCVSLLSIYFGFSQGLIAQDWPNNAILILPLAITPLMLFKGDIIPFSALRSVMVKVGDWSYSIYLWHWLVISVEFVFLRNTNIFTTKETIVLFVPGFLLGVFSYYFIERNRKLSIATTALTVLLALYIVVFDGVSSRVNPEVIPYSNLQLMTGVDIEEEYYFDTVRVKQIQTVGSDHSILVLGDSISTHILPMMQKSERYQDHNIYSVNYQDVVYLVNNWPKIQELIKQKQVDEVMISFFWGQEVTKDVVKLQSMIKNIQHPFITVVRDAPSYSKDLVSCFIRDNSSLLFSGCDFDVAQGLPRNKIEHENVNNWRIMSQGEGQYTILDVHEKLCNQDICPMVINNEFIMRDKRHFNEKLSSTTNKIIGDMIFAP